MKKILETLKQKFMNKFFWNLQITTVLPDMMYCGQFADGSETSGAVLIRGDYKIQARSTELRRRLDLLLGVAANDSGIYSIMGGVIYTHRGDTFSTITSQDILIEEVNEKLKICFDIDFLSNKSWNRRYYVKLG